MFFLNSAAFSPLGSVLPGAIPLRKNVLVNGRAMGVVDQGVSSRVVDEDVEVAVLGLDFLDESTEA